MSNISKSGLIEPQAITTHTSGHTLRHWRDSLPHTSGQRWDDSLSLLYGENFGMKKVIGLEMLINGEPVRRSYPLTEAEKEANQKAYKELMAKIEKDIAEEKALRDAKYAHIPKCPSPCGTLIYEPSTRCPHGHRPVNDVHERCPSPCGTLLIADRAGAPLVCPHGLKCWNRRGQCTHYHDGYECVHPGGTFNEPCTDSCKWVCYDCGKQQNQKFK